MLWQLNTTGIATLEEPSGFPATDSEAATPEYETRSQLLAGFETFAQAQTAQEVLTSPDHGGTGGPLAASIERVDEGTWVDADLATTVEVAGIELTIEVGSAFGHGQHPTTSLVLDLIGRIGLGRLRASQGADPVSVLDFGCGTGVLTLAALASGAGKVHAIDIDPAALEVTSRNLARNGHLVDTRRVEVGAELERGGAVSFDAVLANVLLPVHRQWGPRLTSALAPGGVIVVSGVLERQRGSVLAAYPDLTVGEERRDGDWLSLVLASEPANPPRRRS